MRPPLLTAFTPGRAAREIPQARLLAWLADAHADAEATREQLDGAARDRFAVRIRHAIERVACDPAQIAARGVSVDDVACDPQDRVIYDVRRDPHGAGTRARTLLFDAQVGAYLDAAYPVGATPPRDLVHVTCTGYASPSAPQRLVAERGWGGDTRVAHAYHMGCYAALPAVRIAAGFVATDSPRVDVVHTELCSLHLDPGDHRLEALVVQSLFGDGLIRYAVVPDDGGGARGLAVLALHERIVPGSADAMSWIVSDHGMAMTLARDVPERIGADLRGFVAELFARAGRGPGDARGAIFAVHPGGPRIIDGVRDRLALDEPQVAHSRAVLHDHGNMSSATLPHVWMRLVDDPRIAAGTTIASLAFGPGLTICGALFEKRS